MTSALRWTRHLLLADVIAMLALAAALSGASALGLDIQSFKWPTVFTGGVLMLLAVLLSVAALTLQLIVALQRRAEVN
jgi:hypothetical protein